MNVNNEINTDKNEKKLNNFCQSKKTDYLCLSLSSCIGV